MHTYHSRVGWTWTLQCLVCIATLAGACVISPPIEPVAPDNNYPPYIDKDFLRPAQDRIFVEPHGQTSNTDRANTVSTRMVSLSVEMLLDPNPEDLLFYAWVGKRSGLIEQSEIGRNLDQQELFRGVFFQFERTEIQIDPCSDQLRGRDSETVWLFVADRRFTRISPERIEVEPGGFVQTHAWVLEFAPTLCLNR